MTEQLSDDMAHYVGILEAVVAVLAIKQGLNPETMMGKAIEDITEVTGMETLDTERIIRARWQGRDIAAGRLAASIMPDSLNPVRKAEIPTPPKAPPMKDRLQDYKKRLQALQAAKTSKSIETVEDSPAES